jgi:carbonic anhydrase
MTAKEAREIIKFCGDICGHMDCKNARGFLEATKAAEPLLEVIEKLRADLKKSNELMFTVEAEGGGVPDDIERQTEFNEESVSSSAQVVEKYKKEVLGE